MQSRESRMFQYLWDYATHWGKLKDNLQYIVNLKGFRDSHVQMMC